MSISVHSCTPCRHGKVYALSALRRAAKKFCRQTSGQFLAIQEFELKFGINPAVVILVMNVEMVILGG